MAGTGLPLHLVYNPLGAFLPPPQDELEQTYKRLLQERYGIVFTHLYCLANMPIARFENFLRGRHEYEPYMQLLVEAFNALTLDRTMCRNLLSVDWEGSVYDCDFNQMLDLPLQDDRGRLLKIWDLVPQHLEDQAILVGNHCYGCTAGAGSSCGGALLP